jgi:large subunit ribosomal protein L30
MRATLQALGLRNHQAEVILQDSPALRGQIKRVRHLVEVTPVDDENAEGTSAARTKPRSAKTQSDKGTSK